MKNKFSSFLLAGLLCLAHTIINAQLLTSNNAAITVNSGVGMIVNGDIRNNAGATITNNGAITLTGNWINNSGNNVFGTSAGTVVMSGSAPTIGGTDSTLFNSLSFIAGTPSLLVNTMVGGGGASPAGVLTLNTANLDLNSHTMHVTNPNTSAIQTTSGIILSEDPDNSSMVNWKISSTTGPHTIPFGTAAGTQIPFTFNLASGFAGDVSVSTYATAPTNLPLPVAPLAVTHIRNNAGADNSTNTVDRFWQVNPTGTPTASMTFNWAIGENPANGNVSPAAQRWVSTAAGWELPKPGQFNPTAQSVVVSNVTSYGPWAVALSASPLPIELLTFTAEAQDGKTALCRWATASEINNDFFIIERSRDGELFEVAGKVDGAGNSTETLYYSFTDEKPFSGISYYRLRQMDFDGTVSYSEKVAVKMNGVTKLAVFPNPAHDNVRVLFHSGSAAEYSIRLFDAIGKIVYQNGNYSSEGSNTVDLNISLLAKGVYTMQFVMGETAGSERLVVQ